MKFGVWFGELHVHIILVGMFPFGFARSRKSTMMSAHHLVFLTLLSRRISL